MREGMHIIGHDVVPGVQTIDFFSKQDNPFTVTCDGRSPVVWVSWVLDKLLLREDMPIEIEPV